MRRSLSVLVLLIAFLPCSCSSQSASSGEGGSGTGASAGNGSTPDASSGTTGGQSGDASAGGSGHAGSGGSSAGASSGGGSGGSSGMDAGSDASGNVRLRPYGVNWHPIWYGKSWITARAVEMAELGVQSARFDVPWYRLETAKGVYDETYLGRLDHIVDECTARNIEPLVILLGCPGWANGSLGSKVPPTKDSDYADFLEFLVRRYQGKVTAYEIWNEPDGSWAWTSPDAVRYTSLLKAAYTRAKSVDPNVIILGGSTHAFYSISKNFLTTMYQQGAKDYFDVLSAHAYGDPPLHGDLTPEQVFDNWAAAMLPIMEAHGDGNKKVWITEHGYNTSSKGVSESVQAEYLVRSFDKVKSLPYIETLHYYEVINSTEGGADPDHPSNNYGLQTLSFVRKASYAAYAEMTK